MAKQEKYTGAVFLPLVVEDLPPIVTQPVSDELKNKTVSTDYYDLATVRSENYIG